MNRRSDARATFLTVLLICLGLLLCASAAPPGPGTLLRDDTGLYPRVVRLQHTGTSHSHLLAAVVVPPDGSDPGLSPIYESLDGGHHWTKSPIGTVRDPEAARGLCCIALVELPRRQGRLRAGTLLWSGSVGQQDRSPHGMALRVWASTDVGRTWFYLSSCAHTDSQQGVWEPDFSLAADGSLVCHYSDETDPTHHSQFLAHAVSRDGGQTWSAGAPTVALNDASLRPGMATVRRLGAGRYAMTYEICNWPGASCAAFIRFSKDGLDWGDPATPGTRIMSNTGLSFAHTPVLEWTPGGGPDGTLLLSGQLLMDDAGLAPTPGTGRTLMLNTTGGTGTWIEIPAPFALDNVYDNYCPNYASPLLASPDGRRVLELGTAYDGPLCKPYYGTGAIPGSYHVAHDTRGPGLGQFEYLGAWKADSGHHFSDAQNADVNLRFAGPGVTVDLTGSGRVSVDGGPDHAVSGTYQSGGLSAGPHELSVRPLAGHRLGLTGATVQLEQ